MSENEYRSAVKDGRLKGLPSHADRTYADQWESWGEFLATGRTHQNDKNFLSYHEASRLVRAAGVKSSTEYWKSFREGRLIGLPYSPNEVYKEDWQGWGKFLGTGRTVSKASEFPTYEEARERARAAGVSSRSDYRRAVKEGRLGVLPSAPDQFYSDQWQGWKTFLKTGSL